MMVVTTEMIVYGCWEERQNSRRIVGGKAVSMIHLRLLLLVYKFFMKNKGIKISDILTSYVLQLPNI